MCVFDIRFSKVIRANQIKQCNVQPRTCVCCVVLCCYATRRHFPFKYVCAHVTHSFYRFSLSDVNHEMDVGQYG